MIPELTVALLACARIGVIHSVVFAGFSSQALNKRINDSSCKMAITADGSFKGNKTIDLKNIVDEALKNCPSVEHVLAVKRTNAVIEMQPERNEWIAPLLEEAENTLSVRNYRYRRPVAYPLHIRLNRKTQRDGAYSRKLHGIYRLHL